MDVTAWWNTTVSDEAVAALPSPSGASADQVRNTQDTTAAQIVSTCEAGKVPEESSASAARISLPVRASNLCDDKDLVQEKTSASAVLKDDKRQSGEVNDSKDTSPKKTKDKKPSQDSSEKPESSAKDQSLTLRMNRAKNEVLQMRLDLARKEKEGLQGILCRAKKRGRSRSPSRSPTRLRINRSRSPPRSRSSARSRSYSSSARSSSHSPSRSCSVPVRNRDPRERRRSSVCNRNDFRGERKIGECWPWQEKGFCANGKSCRFSNSHAEELKGCRVPPPRRDRSLRRGRSRSRSGPRQHRNRRSRRRRSSNGDRSQGRNRHVVRRQGQDQDQGRPQAQPPPESGNQLDESSGRGSRNGVARCLDHQLSQLPTEHEVQQQAVLGTDQGDVSDLTLSNGIPVYKIPGHNLAHEELQGLITRFGFFWFLKEGIDALPVTSDEVLEWCGDYKRLHSNVLTVLQALNREVWKTTCGKIAYLFPPGFDLQVFIDTCRAFTCAEHMQECEKSLVEEDQQAAQDVACSASSDINEEDARMFAQAEVPRHILDEIVKNVDVERMDVIAACEVILEEGQNHDKEFAWTMFFKCIKRDIIFKSHLREAFEENNRLRNCLPLVKVEGGNSPSAGGGASGAPGTPGAGLSGASVPGPDAGVTGGSGTNTHNGDGSGLNLSFTLSDGRRQADALPQVYTTPPEASPFARQEPVMFDQRDVPDCSDGISIIPRAPSTAPVPPPISSLSVSPPQNPVINCDSPAFDVDNVSDVSSDLPPPPVMIGTASDPAILVEEPNMGAACAKDKIKPKVCASPAKGNNPKSSSKKNVAENSKHDIDRAASAKSKTSSKKNVHDADVAMPQKPSVENVQVQPQASPLKVLAAYESDPDSDARSEAEIEPQTSPRRLSDYESDEDGEILPFVPGNHVIDLESTEFDAAQGKEVEVVAVLDSETEAWLSDQELQKRQLHLIFRLKKNIFKN